VTHLTTLTFVTPRSLSEEPAETLLRPKLPVMLPDVLNFGRILERLE